MNVTNASSEESSVQDFYSVKNMKTIITVFENFLTDKYNTNSNILNVNLRKEIFLIMQRLKENPYHINMSVNDLNKITLQTLRDIIKKKYLSNAEKKITSKENYLERDKTLFNNRNNVFNDNRNFNENTQLEENNEIIMEKFNKFNEERKEITKKEDENQLKSDDIDQSISQDEFENRLEELQQHRDNLINMDTPLIQNTDQQKVIETFKDENCIINDTSNKNPNIEETNYKHQLMMSTTDFINDRNKLITDQLSDMRSFDPKTIYATNEKIRKNERNEVVKQYENSNTITTFPLITKPTNTIMKEKFVCINSMDRDWINQKNRYNYLVKFNYVHKSTKKVEIYENNPTIPYTKSSLSTGIANISGYYDDNNIFRDAYVASNPLGNVIGYEYVEILIDDNINVQENFKNVKSIEITKVIIPADITNATTGRLYNFNLNYPYVLLQIDEFQDIYEGTNDSIRKSFCQLVYENFYRSSNGRGYIILKPVQNEKKTFHPSLLPSMPSLNISIVTPNGELLNDSTDGYSILQVSYEPFNRTYLKIITNNYFDKNEFYSGDKIFIKRYCAFKLDDTQDSEILSTLNNFINTESGHNICKIGDASENSYYKSFYIKAPGLFSSETGIFTIDEDQIKNLVTFNCKNNIESNPSNGFVLNMSLQNSISMKITTVDVDSIII
jgi:hypothetical protein